MRHPIFTQLSLAAIVFVVGGCRQTNGTTAGPLMPMGGLSPVTPGQAPILGPFGGTTRVTPPPTGSFSPSGTLGNIAPAPGYGPAPSGYAPQVNSGAFNQPIGSGVQTASAFGQPAMNQHANWTETGATLPNNSYSQGRDPRAAGMQVIDLTGSPNPPNYRPSTFQTPQAMNNASPIISPSMMPAGQVAQSAQQFLQPMNSQPMNRAVYSAAPFPTTSPQFESRTTASPLPRASTASLPNPNEDSTLNWRRPGSQF